MGIGRILEDLDASDSTDFDLRSHLLQGFPFAIEIRAQGRTSR